LLIPCREEAFIACAATGILLCPLAGRAFTFLLDKKSKQKNQEQLNRFGILVFQKNRSR
jgi:hypothetical protein